MLYATSQAALSYSLDLASKIQTSIERSVPFIGSPSGDVFVIPHPEDASPVHVHDAMASLVRSGSLSSYRYLGSGESDMPVILAVTATPHVQG